MEITVYTKPSCMQCTMTEKLLDKLDIPHRIVDITADEHAYGFVSSLGYTSAPVVVAGERHWSGFRVDKIKELSGAG